MRGYSGGLKGAVAAATQGNPVISSPWDGTYFYVPQVPEEVRLNYKSLNTLELAYAFNPVPAELSVTPSPRPQGDHRLRIGRQVMSTKPKKIVA